MIFFHSSFLKIYGALIVAVCTFFPLLVSAQTHTSEHYSIEQGSLSGGGVPSSQSASYSQTGSFGEPVVGPSSNGSYGSESGFNWGAGEINGAGNTRGNGGNNSGGNTGGGSSGAAAYATGQSAGGVTGTTSAVSGFENQSAQRANTDQDGSWWQRLFGIDNDGMNADTQTVWDTGSEIYDTQGVEMTEGTDVHGDGSQDSMFSASKGNTWWIWVLLILVLYIRHARRKKKYSTLY